MRPCSYPLTLCEYMWEKLENELCRCTSYFSSKRHPQPKMPEEETQKILQVTFTKLEPPTDMSHDRERIYSHIEDTNEKIEMSFMEDTDIGRPITHTEYQLAIMTVVAALLNPCMYQQ